MISNCSGHVSLSAQDVLLEAVVVWGVVEGGRHYCLMRSDFGHIVVIFGSDFTLHSIFAFAVS